MTDETHTAGYTIRSDGSVDLGYRVIPVPSSISEEAMALLRAAADRARPSGAPLWERRGPGRSGWSTTGTTRADR